MNKWFLNLDAQGKVLSIVYDILSEFGIESVTAEVVEQYKDKGIFVTETDFPAAPVIPELYCNNETGKLEYK